MISEKSERERERDLSPGWQGHTRPCVQTPSPESCFLQKKKKKRTRTRRPSQRHSQTWRFTRLSPIIQPPAGLWRRPEAWPASRSQIVAASVERSDTMCTDTQSRVLLPSEEKKKKTTTEPSSIRLRSERAPNPTYPFMALVLLLEGASASMIILLLEPPKLVVPALASVMLD